MDLSDFFIKAHAQQADEVAKSTIPFSPGTIPTATGFPVTPTNTPGQDPTIFMEADKTQLALNDKVHIKVQVSTATKQIKSLKFTVKYNPQFFTITDANIDEPNVQITYNDTFFINQLNEVDISTGTIAISGSSDQGTAAITARNVADFELTAIKEGFSPVSLDIEQSSLLDANNVDILKVLGQPLSFTISSSPITITPTFATPIPTLTGNLPRNGLFDGLGAGQALISGALLIAIGAYLFNLQKNVKKKV